jgi:ketosteroid isomerase-like protein
MSEINKTIVKDVYSAFQRRDIPALLNCLSEDVHWFSIGPPQIIPTAGTRYGRKQVEEYLYTLEAIEEVKSFTPQEFIADGEKVVAVGEMQSRIKSTDILIKTPWVHIFTFRKGKISDFRSFSDTAAVVAALAEKQVYSAKAATFKPRSVGLI